MFTSTVSRIGHVRGGLHRALLLLALGTVGCDMADPGATATEEAARTEMEATATTGLSSGGECRGTIGAIQVEQIIVPEGSKCVLKGTIVEENVEVKPRATLVAQGAIVGGNIQAAEAAAVTVKAQSRVEGNVQLKQGGAVYVLRSRIDGDLQIEQNARAVEASYNTVRGNMQVFQNTGGVKLVQNRVAENLQCKENNPRPTGSGNVAGSKEDQCARL